jgi:uncharacterized protein
MEDTTKQVNKPTEEGAKKFGKNITDVEAFLKFKRFAMVGVSRNEKEFSRTLFRDLRAQGYDVVPVNPAALQLDGVKCEATVRKVSPPVEGALLMVPAGRLMEALESCADAGMMSVWIYGMAGPAKIHRQAIRFCREREIALIAGYCPYMFLPKTAFFHRFHGMLNRVVGKYPR